MTLNEAAARLGVRPATLRQQIANGRLRASKRGRDWWVTEGEVARYLAESRGRAGRPVSAAPARRRHRGPSCACGHALSSHRQDPADPYVAERCRTCGCAGFLNRDEARMQSRDPGD